MQRCAPGPDGSRAGANIGANPVLGPPRPRPFSTLAKSRCHLVVRSPRNPPANPSRHPSRRPPYRPPCSCLPSLFLRHKRLRRPVRLSRLGDQLQDTPWHSPAHSCGRSPEHSSPHSPRHLSGLPVSSRSRPQPTQDPLLLADLDSRHIHRQCPLRFRQRLDFPKRTNRRVQRNQRSHRRPHPIPLRILRKRHRRPRKLHPLAQERGPQLQVRAGMRLQRCASTMLPRAIKWCLPSSHRCAIVASNSASGTPLPLVPPHPVIPPAHDRHIRRRRRAIRQLALRPPRPQPQAKPALQMRRDLR